MTFATPSAGHAPGLPACNRRDLLRASCVILAPALLASPALALAGSANLPTLPAETPVLALYREHERIDALFAGANDDGEGDVLFEQLLAVEDRLAEEPAITLADLAAKVPVLTQIREASYGTIWEPGLRAELEAILAEALA